MSTSAARGERFDLDCEIWYLRALYALARRADDVEIARNLEVRVSLARELRDRIPLGASAGRRDALVQRLGLGPALGDFLDAVAAFSLDPRLTAHAEALGGPLGRRGLSVATYQELAELEPRDGRQLVAALATDNALVTSGFLLTSEEQVPPAARPYRISPRLLGHLLGDDTCEPELGVVRAEPRWVFDDEQQRTLAELGRVVPGGQAVIVVEGPKGSGRRSAVAHATGKELIVLDADRSDKAQLERGLWALRRETLLRDGIAVIADADRITGDSPRHPLSGFINGFRGPLVITTTTTGLDLDLDRPAVRVPWRVPDASVRRQLWLDLGGVPPSPELDQLAYRYAVGAGAIERAVRSTRAVAPERLDAETFGAGLRHNIVERMGGLAQRVEITQRWDDVVLSDDIMDQIQGLIARVRHGHDVLDQWGYRSKIARGGGVAALFSGPPGTGKTMVSGLIAGELDLELYQVDLSQVVSKWVGETEKQLARVFDAAEEGHALLLFDEADSLFGQRSAEVKSAVDRYANLEVNFLLQRIEAFSGITILTTNLDANIDRALKRRLAAHVVFAPPDEDERALLWERMTRTGNAPLERDVDYDELARTFATMTGANIRNAALSAAFLAAAGEEREITQEHLMRAARAEYRSMGHVLAEQSSRRGGLA